MARGINKVILIGNLGKDPEARSFANGGSVTNATLAVSDSWRDKDGNQQERTEWLNLVFHNKLGEIAAQYLRKGSKVYIEGSIRTRKYQDKTSGQDRYVTEIHATDMQMLDGKPGGGEGGGGSYAPRASSGQDRGGYSGGAAASSGGAARSAPASAPADPGFDDDDIPF